MLVDSVCSIQNILHRSNSSALPVALLTAASGLVVYRHAFDERADMAFQAADPLKTFLLLIILQMTPLVFLEMKVMSCSDPIALLMRFGPKVMLMHISFLVLRILSAFCTSTASLKYESIPLSNVIGLVVAFFVMWRGFRARLSLRFVLEHSDVLGLTLLACIAACFTTWLESTSESFLRHHMSLWQGHSQNLNRVMVNAVSYAEVCAFVPAVVLLYQREKTVTSVEDATNPRRAAALFFGFLISFYLADDVYGAYQVWRHVPLVAAGHLVHYFLLLDFAGFWVALTWDSWLLDGTDIAPSPKASLDPARSVTSPPCAHFNISDDTTGSIPPSVSVPRAGIAPSPKASLDPAQVVMSPGCMHFDISDDIDTEDEMEVPLQ